MSDFTPEAEAFLVALAKWAEDAEHIGIYLTGAARVFLTSRDGKPSPEATQEVGGVIDDAKEWRYHAEASDRTCDRLKAENDQLRARLAETEKKLSARWEVTAALETELKQTKNELLALRARVVPEGYYREGGKTYRPARSGDKWDDMIVSSFAPCDPPTGGAS